MKELFIILFTFWTCGSIAGIYAAWKIMTRGRDAEG